MKTACISFLAGAVAIAAAAVAGGAFLLLAGFILALAALCAAVGLAGVRRSGLFLVALADALNAVRRPQTVLVAAEPVDPRQDVIQVLLKWGSKRKDAEQRVDAAIAAGHRDLESMLRYVCGSLGRAA